MSDDTELFCDEFKVLYKESKVTLGELVRVGGRLNPPVTVSTTTVSAWKNGTQVPGKNLWEYFLAMVEYMAAKAERHGSSYVPQSRAWWRGMLGRAHEERYSNRGGRPPGAKARPATGPNTLDPRPVGFTGRREQLAQLLEWLKPTLESDDEISVLSAVVGMGGVGKTALALEAAHQAWSRGWFPGGALFADLHGYAPKGSVEVSTVIDQFLRDLGVKGKDVPSDEDGKIALWRSLLSSRAAERRPVLVLLDNALGAEHASQLRPDPPHRMLVTSRQTLSALPARSLKLGPLSPAEAEALLDRELRAAHHDDDRVTVHPDDAGRLAELCGCLPLALRIIAALLRDEPDRPLADQAAELADARYRLDVLEYDDGRERPLAVRAAFDLSYRRLREEQAQAFRLLSCAPGGDISTEAASALLGSPRPLARRALVGLLRAHLLESRPGERWSMHDLVHLFAQEQGEASADQDQRAAAFERLLTHYIALADAAHSCLTSVEPSAPFSSRDSALAWLEQERPALVSAAVAAVSAERPDLAYLLSHGLSTGGFLRLRRYLDNWVTAAKTALTVTVALLDDPGPVAQAWGNFAVALEHKGDYVHALAALENAEKGFTQVHDRAGAANVLIHRGWILHHLGAHEKALEASREAQRMLEGGDNERAMTIAKHNEGLALRNLNKLEEALAVHTATEDTFTQVSDPHNAALAKDAHGVTLRRRGEFKDALAAHLAAAEALEQFGDSYNLAKVLNHAGLAHLELGELNEALQMLSRAHDLLLNFDDPAAVALVLFNRGQTRLRLKCQDEAILDFEQASSSLREASQHSANNVLVGQRGTALLARGTALYERGLSRGDAGSFSEAGKDFQEASAAFAEAATALHEVGRRDEAMAAKALAERCQQGAEIALGR